MTGDDLTVSSLLAAAHYLGDSLPSPNVPYLRLYRGGYHIRYIEYASGTFYIYLQHYDGSIKHTTIPASESETPSKLLKIFHDVLHSPSLSPLQHKASVACTPYQLFWSLGRTLNLTVSRCLLLSPKLSPVAFCHSVNIHSLTNDVSLNLTVNRSLLGSLRPEHFTAAMHYPMAQYRRTSVSRSLIISHALQEKIYHNITSHLSTCWTQLIAVHIQQWVFTLITFCNVLNLVTEHRIKSNSGSPTIASTMEKDSRLPGHSIIQPVDQSDWDRQLSAFSLNGPILSLKVYWTSIF